MIRRLKVLDPQLEAGQYAEIGRFWPVYRDRNHAAAGVRLHADTRTVGGPELFLQTYRCYFAGDAYVCLRQLSSPIPNAAWWRWLLGAHRARHFHKALDTDSARIVSVLGLHRRSCYQVEMTCSSVRHSGRDLRPGARQASSRGLEKLHEYLEKRLRGKKCAEEAKAGQAGGGRLRAGRKTGRRMTPATWRMATVHRQQPTERSLRGIAVGRHYVESMIMCSFVSPDPAG